MKGKKKILIISNFFYPDITPRSFRTTELAKELAQQGHVVTIYLPDKGIDYSDFEKENKLSIHYMGPLRWKGINISGKLSMLKRAVRRTLQLLFEYPVIELMFKVNSALRKLTSKEQYDLLISVAVPYPIHWGVAMARSKKNSIAKTWVADCGDPYMGDTTDSFKKLFYFKYVEKWFSRKTDYITIPRVEMKTNFYSEFHDKIVGIPQGFNFDETGIKNDYVKNSIPTFAFAGTFIPKARDPRELMDYLSHLNVDFKFVVYTKNPAMLVPYIKKLGDKLEILNYIPRKKLIGTLSKMDFLVNISYDPVYQAPSKLIDYGITGRPIMNIASTIDTKAVNSFIKGDYTNAFQIENLDQFRIDNVAKAFLELTKENKRF